MDERLRFVARVMEGEKMAVLCREFGISRKTGYKTFERYKDCGLEGLKDRSRRPYRQANQLPVQIEALILGLKRQRPSWGAPKIREKIRRQYSGIHPPAISTVHAVLDRHGLVAKDRKRRYKANGTQRSRPDQSNDLWCADYKGEFMLADRRYCYPLTVTDFARRYHQALAMKCPGEVYRASLRPYRGLTELVYPFHDRTITVTHCGRICWGKRKIHLSTALAGQNVGIREVEDRLWQVTFMTYDLGFEAKVLPMSPE